MDEKDQNAHNAKSTVRSLYGGGAAWPEVRQSTPRQQYRCRRRNRRHFSKPHHLVGDFVFTGRLSRRRSALISGRTMPTPPGASFWRSQPCSRASTISLPSGSATACDVCVRPERGPWCGPILRSASAPLLRPDGELRDRASNHPHRFFLRSRAACSMECQAAPRRARR